MNGMPARTAAAIASFRDCTRPPPSDMEATDFPIALTDVAFETTQLMPAMTPENAPDPDLFKTFTAMTFDFLATPNFVIN